MKPRVVTACILACVGVLGWLDVLRCFPSQSREGEQKAVSTAWSQPVTAEDHIPSASFDSGRTQEDEKTGSAAPRLVSLRVDPARPVTGDTLRAEVTVQGENPDEDLVVIRWHMNGQDVEETGPVLKHPVRYGDSVSVTAELQSSNGKRQILSTYVLVQNAPPTIRVARASMKAEEYVVELVTEDAEDDAVALRLTQAPEGMVLDPASKTLQWRLGPEHPPGVYQVVVEGTDAVGNVAQYQLDVTVSQP
ncbi:MAG: putative Ig domain-containing protein [Desulfosoma sp.]|uniref:putative Ig domain-containing protein n=1 Tax=Desulfosoma sp. TaxID=2603217 RepID=UPI0040498BD1